MPTRISIFFFFFFISVYVFSQTGWDEWVPIYSDENMTVELQIYYSDNSCQDEGKLFKYRTRLTGRYKTRPNYVNWDMNYVDCNNNLFYQQINADLWTVAGGMVDGLIFESLDNRFQASYLVQPFYNVLASKTKRFDSGLMPKSYSVKPLRIDTITFNSLTSLLATGGYLGAEAEWCWHENSCDGQLIGKGKIIKVRPEQTTTYFVRAEGDGCITKCVQITLQGTGKESLVITQEPKKSKSIAATGIIAPHSICPSDSALLKVFEGHLEDSAVWAWYTGDDLGKRLGTGATLYVKPTQKTTYYVRAEGTMDTSEHVQTEINILETSSERFAIIYKGKPVVCEGEKVEMEVDNYVIDDDGIWNWYLDSSSGKIVASGAFVEFYPVKTSTYILRRDGTCNTSNGTSVTIYVNQNSDITNARIITPDTFHKWEKTILTVTGGILGNDAQWYWYKDTCTINKYLGTGDSIAVIVRRRAKYFVMAKGKCSETECVVLRVKPIRLPLKHRKFKKFKVLLFKHDV